MSLVCLTTRTNHSPVTIAANTIAQVQDHPDGYRGSLVRCKGGAKYAVAEDVESVTKAWKAAGGASDGDKPKAEKPKAAEVN